MMRALILLYTLIAASRVSAQYRKMGPGEDPLEEPPLSDETAQILFGGNLVSNGGGGADTTSANTPDSSLWHDVPLSDSEQDGGDEFIFNYFCEIPKGSMKKLELMKHLPGNPILQDTREVWADKNMTELLYKRPRFLSYGPYPVNYGALPQTYENPLENDPLTGDPGDNDPMDVVEVSSEPCETGKTYSVRVLCALGLVDDGSETDWKIVTINTENEEYGNVTSCDSDAENGLPEPLLDAIYLWFRDYKTAEGRPMNIFYQGEGKELSTDRNYISAEKSLEVILQGKDQYDQNVEKLKADGTVKEPEEAE